jgi:hypothetical protein
MNQTSTDVQADVPRGGPSDDRLRRARALLAREGIRGHVSVAGAEAEILAVHADPAAREALARLAPEVRAFGFRYVTIDLGAEHPRESGNT